MSAPIFVGLRLLAAILLYAFVGWSFYLMWLMLKSQADFLSSKKIPPITVLLPHLNNEITLVTFEQPELIVGRDSDCEIHLDDSAVSARHARLSFHHGHWWVEDSGSKNGTALNDNPLTVPTIITNGDTISCGNITLTINLPEYRAD
jgi:pSer/pThr/pTyr-binding forkhead associated (FHA) protein